MKAEAVEGSFDRLVLKNVRCFREATIELDPKLTVLLGENGAGKTTVIEALASLAYGDNEGLATFPLARKAKSGEIALYPAGAKRPAARWTSGASSGAPRRLPQDRCVLAYGRYRRVYFQEEEGVARRPADPRVDLELLARRASQTRTVTIFRPDNHLLRDLARYLSALHEAGRSDPRAQAVWARLNASLVGLGQGLSGIEMERGETAYFPQVVRNGLPLEIRELSDGYQAILVIVFDLILRYFYLFPDLADPTAGPATVAIDEVDLHLHPRWQRTVAAQLTTLFPNTQFVMTTHSPAVIQGAIDQKFQVVSLREKHGEAVARTLTAKERGDLEGAEVGSVLFEKKLFGVASRYSVEFEKVEKRLSQLRKKVEHRTATEEERGEIFVCLDTLQGLVIADERRRADGSYLSQMTALRKAFLEDLAAELARAKE